MLLSVRERVKYSLWRQSNCIKSPTLFCGETELLIVKLFSWSFCLKRCDCERLFKTQVQTSVINFGRSTTVQYRPIYTGWPKKVSHYQIIEKSY